MNRQVKLLMEEARKLPAGDRVRMVDELLISLAQPTPELDQIWGREAKKRLEAYRNGRLKAVDARELLDELKRRSQ